MAKVKSFNCQLLISKSTTLLQMSVNFYGVLSLFLCMVLISGPLPDQSLKKEFQLFLRSYKRRLSYCSPVLRSRCIFFTAQTIMPSGVLLLHFELRYSHIEATFTIYVS